MAEPLHLQNIRRQLALRNLPETEAGLAELSRAIREETGAGPEDVTRIILGSDPRAYEPERATFGTRAMEMLGGLKNADRVGGVPLGSMGMALNMLGGMGKNAWDALTQDRLGSPMMRPVDALAGVVGIHAPNLMEDVEQGAWGAALADVLPALAMATPMRISGRAVPVPGVRGAMRGMPPLGQTTVSGAIKDALGARTVQPFLDEGFALRPRARVDIGPLGAEQAATRQFVADLDRQLTTPRLQPEWEAFGEALTDTANPGLARAARGELDLTGQFGQTAGRSSAEVMDQILAQAPGYADFARGGPLPPNPFAISDQLLAAQAERVAQGRMIGEQALADARQQLAYLRRAGQDIGEQTLRNQRPTMGPSPDMPYLDFLNRESLPPYLQFLDELATTPESLPVRIRKALRGR